MANTSVDAQSASATVAGFETPTQKVRVDGLGTPMFFGGNALIGNLLQWFTYNGNAASAMVAGPLGLGTGQAAETYVSDVQTLTRLSWNGAAADATTALRVFVNGAAVRTVTLTGARGSVALSSALALAIGDVVAVQYFTGTPPAGFNCWMN